MKGAISDFPMDGRNLIYQLIVDMVPRCRISSPNTGSQNLGHQQVTPKLQEKRQRKWYLSQGLNVVPQFFGVQNWRWETWNQNMSSQRRRRIIFEISLNNSLIYDSFISQALSDTSAERKNICSKVHRSQGVEAFIEFLCQGWIYRSHRRTKDLGAIKALVHRICNHRITGLHLSGKGGL